LRIAAGSSRLTRNQTLHDEGGSAMEFGTLEREIHVDATPDVVYTVISTPEHMRGWWPADVQLDEQVPGATGWVSFDQGSAPAHVAPLTVVEADPPRRFSFRWVYDDGVTAAPGNSLLVTFDLVPFGEGTLVRLTETGFREKGWEAAVLEKQYHDHSNGWDYFLPRLGTYVSGLVSSP
jgi:uncharacterized protein YndB with AHSA1/START domain